MADKVGFVQADRALRIDSPLGADRLLLRSISGQEAISQLFRFQLELVSEDDSIKLSDLIGKAVTIHIERQDGEVRWHGHISRFSQGARDERFTHYRAEMVPWLWFLSRTADCRIFQNKTVPEIIQKIFKDLGFSDFALRLHGTYRAWEYCVQYRETDLNFVSRLMEEEGIFYFFEHAPDGSKHTLVLADSDAAHKPCPNQPKASCEASSGGTLMQDVITELRLEQEFRPSAWAHTDYNFKTPSTSLMVNLEEGSAPEKPSFEIYDFPGSYEKRDQGDKLARARLQETRAFHHRATGSSTCRAFGTGYTVEVQDHYRSDVNGKYVLTAVHHQANLSVSYTSGGSNGAGGSGEFFYSNTFEAIPAAVPFRAPRTTPKPVVQGCQSAVVTGPAGEEIYTDQYGRVKVQFHWDREGKRDENTSCWIRVSQPWAGKGWGSVAIPRIDQEVLVDFLEGDPDQPIIIGRVYNAEQMPPNGLPAAGMVSGIKSNSTPGGGGYNEMSMDDTKGKEKVTIHAQYDMATTVEHDDTQTVVSGDRTITVKAGKHTETIKGDTAITIQTGNHSLTVSTGTHTHTVKGAVTETYDATQATTVKNDITIKSTAAKITVDAKTEILLICGASSLSMKANGDIKLSGKNVEISGEATTKIGVGNQNVSCSTSKVETTGAAINSSAVGMHEITGAIVKIN